MAWSDDDYITAFDTELGELATVSPALVTAAQKIQWFNEAQERLLSRWERFTDVTWEEGDRDVDLPSDFVFLSQIIFDLDGTVEPWRVWGQTLIIADPEGANGDGGARIFYRAEWPVMTTGTVATELSRSEDFACLHYALSRFYKRLASNRAFYKRYATLVGQNAVTMSDLQQEADRYYQDFLEARDDLPPEPPTFFYNAD